MNLRQQIINLDNHRFMIMYNLPITNLILKQLKNSNRTRIIRAKKYLKGLNQKYYRAKTMLHSINYGQS